MDDQTAVLRLAALAHETRLHVFRRLMSAGPKGEAAGSLSSALDMPPTSLSFHLKTLTTAGLVTVRREGRSLLYSVNVAETSDLLRFLSMDCCGGHPEMCGFDGPDTMGSTHAVITEECG